VEFYMNKYILVSLLLSTAFSVKVNAQTQCASYWINPKTGQEECLDSLGRQSIKSSPYPGYIFLTESVQGVKTYIRERKLKLGDRTNFRTIAVDKSGNTLESSDIADCKNMRLATRSEVLRSPQGKVLRRKWVKVPIFLDIYSGTTGLDKWNYACFGKLPTQL
jgi:hypothetical protein